MVVSVSSVSSIVLFLDVQVQVSRLMILDVSRTPLRSASVFSHAREGEQ